ncbi:MAG TPA: hypothetical protein VGC42_25465 [Kofleriaceae bacterium]
MKVLALGLVGCASLVACQAHSGDDDGDYKVQPGGGGSGGGTTGNGGGGATGDGGTDALTGDAGVAIAGRVCLLTDLRKLGQATACAATGAGNLTVSLGNRTAITAVNGAFSIIAPAGAQLWQVTGDDKSQSTAIEPSLVPFSTDALLPVVSVATYTNLESQNSVVGDAEQQASVFIRVLKNGVPGVNVTASSSPAGQRGALYDAGTQVVWSDNLTGTGAAGVVWVPAIQIGQAGSSSASITLTPPMGGTARTVSVPVANQAITFATFELQ